MFAQRPDKLEEELQFYWKKHYPGIGEGKGPRRASSVASSPSKLTRRKNHKSTLALHAFRVEGGKQRADLAEEGLFVNQGAEFALTQPSEAIKRMPSLRLPRSKVLRDGEAEEKGLQSDSFKRQTR